MVGGEAKTYKIQRMILTNASEWFVKALNERFTEGKELTLRFPETDPRVVEYFLYFLVHGNAPLHRGANAPQGQETNLLAVRIWTFGGKHFLPKLQNQALECLGDQFIRGNLPSIETIGEALENSAPKCALRRFMMKVLISGLKRETTNAYSPEKLQPLEGIAGAMGDLAHGIVVYRPPFKISDYLVKEA